ncbi:hypothetical protein Syun_003325 [Stephania yunnanensis]|uniref:Uncharacterized protein n=1 Tax=Stephania yunnanensis TaxID=152371 RepID=A0AAP0L2H4_9MAGN
MISGGFSLEVFKQWAPSENNLIALPGFELGYWVRAIYVWLQNIDNGSLCCDGRRPVAAEESGRAAAAADYGLTSGGGGSRRRPNLTRQWRITRGDQAAAAQGVAEWADHGCTGGSGGGSKIGEWRIQRMGQRWRRTAAPEEKTVHRQRCRRRIQRSASTPRGRSGRGARRLAVADERLSRESWSTSMMVVDDDADGGGGGSSATLRRGRSWRFKSMKWGRGGEP